MAMNKFNDDGEIQKMYTTFLGAQRLHEWWRKRLHKEIWP